MREEKNKLEPTNQDGTTVLSEVDTVVRRELTCDEQLKLWVGGESIHNSTRDECCPDFSCCRPEMLADKETRIMFLNASEETRHSMLMGFLGECFSDKKVYIAGQTDQVHA